MKTVANTQAPVRPASLPNILTYLRILAVPAIVLCLILIPGGPGRWWALAVYIGACLTDWLDGYLARVWDQQSMLGRMLDPIADKLLVATALMLLVAGPEPTIGSWSLIAALVILIREISVSGLREFLAGLKNVRVPVTRLAKYKTTLQMVAIGFLLIGPAGDRIARYYFGDLGLFTYVGLLLLWVSALITVYTGYDYFRAGVRHLMEDEAP